MLSVMTRQIGIVTLVVKRSARRPGLASFVELEW
jgi:hypothetical protein